MVVPHGPESSRPDPKNSSQPAETVANPIGGGATKTSEAALKELPPLPPMAEILATPDPASGRSTHRNSYYGSFVHQLEETGRPITKLGMDHLNALAQNPPRHLGLILARQQAIEAIHSSPENFQVVAEFLSSVRDRLSTIEYFLDPMYQKRNRSYFFEMQQAVTEIVSAAEKADWSFSPLLQVLIEEVRAFKKSRIFALHTEPICHTGKELALVSEVGKVQGHLGKFCSKTRTCLELASLGIAAYPLSFIYDASPSIWTALPFAIAGSLLITFVCGPLLRRRAHKPILDQVAYQIEKSAEFDRVQRAIGTIDGILALAKYSGSLAAKGNGLPKIEDTPAFSLSMRGFKNTEGVSFDAIDLGTKRSLVLSGESPKLWRLAELIIGNQILAQLGSRVHAIEMQTSIPDKILVHSGPSTEEFEDGTLRGRLNRGFQALSQDARVVTPKSLILVEDNIPRVDSEETNWALFKIFDALRTMGTGLIVQTAHGDLAVSLEDKGYAAYCIKDGKISTGREPAISPLEIATANGIGQAQVEGIILPPIPN